MEYTTILSVLQNVALLENYKTFDRVVDTTVYVADSVYKRHESVFVTWQEHENNDHILRFLFKYPGSVILSPSTQNENKIEEIHEIIKYAKVVLFAQEPNDLESFLFYVNNVLIDPIQVIVTLTYFADIGELEKYTKLAWANDVSDIIIISKSDDTEDISMTTYFPYSDGICGNFKPVALPLKNKPYFPPKFRNLQGCPVRVTLLHFVPYVILEFENETVTHIGGIDGTVYRYAIESINATSNVVSSKEHGGMGTFINGHGTGSFGDLTNGIADIFAPAAIVNSKRYSAAQISPVYETLDVYWCAPNRREIYEWAKVFLPFFNNVTVFICLSFVVFIIVATIIQRSKYHQPPKRKNIVFITYGLFMGQEMKFEINSSLFNGLFMLWIWFCQVVRIEYQGDLVDGLQQQILEPSFENLEQAVQGVDAYGGVEVFREFYRNTPYEAKYRVLPLKEIPPYINEISDGKQRFALVTDIMLVRLFRKKLQVLEEPVIRAHTCLYMRPRWPASTQIKKNIDAIIACGWVDKILKDHLFQWALKAEQEETDLGPTVIDMTMVGALFLGLSAQMLICCIILFLEILHNKMSLKRFNE